MMKRITALALALAFLLSLSTAFAWSCPSCGSEMNGKFCTECGTKKPANVCPACGTDFGESLPKFCTECGTRLTAVPAPTATPAPAAQSEAPEITYASQTSSGAIGVLWMADGVQEYTVEYILRQSDDPYADRAANAGFNVISGKNSIGLSTCSNIIPGEDYWIGLFDAQGRGHYAPFEGEPTGTFDDFVITPTVLPQREINGEKDTVKALSLQEIEAGVASGLYFGMFYKNPGETLERDAHIILDAPNGARYPISGKLTFEAGSGSSQIAGWENVNLTNYFTALKKSFGAIPAGEYRVSLYLDMELAFTTTFDVQEKAVPTDAPKATATPAPQEERAVISDIVSNGDGTVTVSWTGGKAPYKVQYTLKKSDDFAADRAAARAVGAYWNGATDIEGQSVTLGRLVPGEEYWIAVLDANEKGQRWTYTCETGEFTDFETSLTVSPRAKTGETTEDLRCIPADSAGAEDDTQHGVYMRLTFSNPCETRKLMMQIVLTLANGFKYVNGVGEMEFASGEDRWWEWQFYSTDALLEHVRSYAGSLPEGDMTVDVYLDGKLAGSGVVPVKTMLPVTITDVVDQGGGQYSLTWEDNGNGPYSVYFHQRFTEDAAADRDDARSSGRWVVAEGVAANQLTLTRLIPGLKYWIAVEDSLGTVGYYACDLPAAGASDLEMVITQFPRKNVDGAYTDLTAFSAAALNGDHAEAYGLYLDLAYINPAQEVEKTVHMVLTLPNGVCFSEDVVEVPFYPQGSTHWQFYDLEWAFGNVKRWYGEVLQGEYRLEVYVEGDYAGASAFTVTK